MRKQSRSPKTRRQPRQRLTIKQCREMLGLDATVSDEDIVQLRDEYYVIARVWFDTGNIDMNPHEIEESDTLTEDERDEAEERAAILQFEGGLSRPEADRLAMALIMGQEKGVRR